MLVLGRVERAASNWRLVSSSDHLHHDDLIKIKHVDGSKGALAMCRNDHLAISRPALRIICPISSTAAGCSPSSRFVQQQHVGQHLGRQVEQRHKREESQRAVDVRWAPIDLVAPLGLPAQQSPSRTASLRSKRSKTGRTRPIWRQIQLVSTQVLRSRRSRIAARLPPCDLRVAHNLHIPLRSMNRESPEVS